METELQVNELRTIQLDDLKVNYVQQGKGSPVILTHGLAASLHDWDDLLPELAVQGMRVMRLTCLVMERVISLTIITITHSIQPLIITSHGSMH
jgi:hypothetical protein